MKPRCRMPSDSAHNDGSDHDRHAVRRVSVRGVSTVSSLLLAVLALALLANDAVASELPSPFADLGTSRSVSYDARAQFAIASLIIVGALVAAVWICLAACRGLAPRYGTRVIRHPATGVPTMRQTNARPTDESMNDDAGSPSDRSRAGCCDSASCCSGQEECDSGFWCPPCLLQCSCLSCLWCGSRCCCGHKTCSSWTFSVIYRSEAGRYWALVVQIITLALTVLALAFDRWSEDRSFEFDSASVQLHVGLIKMRVPDDSVSYACGDASGADLLMCGSFRTAASLVLALGLLACLLLASSLAYSISLLCRGRGSTPHLWSLSVASFVSLLGGVLVWSLSAHLLLETVYPASLSLGPSWGALILAAAINAAWTIYVRGNVQCTGVDECGDREVRRQEDDHVVRRRDPHDQMQFVNGTPVTPAPWNNHPTQHDEREHARSNQVQPVSLQMEPPRTALRPWHANDAIPAEDVLALSSHPRVVDPHGAWDMKHVDEWRRSDLARRRAEHEHYLDGVAPPRFLDPHRVDLTLEPTPMRTTRRDTAAAAAMHEQDLTPLPPDGLERRDVMRASFGPPPSRSYHANDAIATPMVIRTNHAEVRTPFARSLVQSPDRFSSPLRGGGAAVSDASPYRLREVVRPSPPPALPPPAFERAESQFRVLAPSYVRDSLQVDEAELDETLELQRRRRLAEEGMTVPRTHNDGAFLSPPSALGRSFRLPPLQAPPSMRVVSSSPPPVNAAETLSEARFSPAQHPFFASQPASPLPPPKRALEHAREEEPRVYHYTADQPSHRPSYAYPAGGGLGGTLGGYGYGRGNPPPSVSSRGDMHFTGTFSQAQLAGAGLGSTQAGPLGNTLGSTFANRVGPQLYYDAHAQQHAYQSQPESPRFALNRAPSLPHLRVQVDADPLARTIATPQPYHGRPRAREEPAPHHRLDDIHDDDDEREAPPRRVPLAPQTPRIVDGPQSATVLRSPAHPPPRGYEYRPYSDAFQ